MQPSWAEFAKTAARLFGCQLQADPAATAPQPDLLTDAATGSGRDAVKAAGASLIADAGAAWRSAGEMIFPTLRTDAS